MRLLSRLIFRMLEPFPGSSGNQCAKMPNIRPAAAIAGMISQESCDPNPNTPARERACATSLLNAKPTPSASGASMSATAVKR